MSVHLRNPITATVIYYDIFDYPLTLGEVHKFLINPSRISKVDGGIGEIKLSDIASELDKLVSSGIIGRNNDFYFIKDREDICELRMKRAKIAEQKWKKFNKLMKYLALAPYLRGVFVSGSMALDNTDEKSDFDVLIIAKSGRLYSCRFFLWVISTLTGIRRKKYEKVAPNKLCFNHYIADSSLHISHESIFNAQSYINLKPAMVPDDLFNKFYAGNIWINNFVYNFHPKRDIGQGTVSGNLSGFAARLGEVLLNNYVGDWLEFRLKKYQQKLIANNPRTYEAGGRVVFNDNELEFHPMSFEKVVIEKYKAGLRKFGIVSYIEEKDSGLLR